MTQDVILQAPNSVGHITLNRPNALNALNMEMVGAITAQLEKWANDDTITSILIEGEGDRAFCAGGDIRHIYKTGRTDKAGTLEFFTDEYRLNAIIHHYPKPYIPIINGIAMGGGVGVSCHGSHVIVTENSTIAMPENTIGFIPDVGTTYILSRLPGNIGLFVGMTGYRMRAADAIFAGFATAFVPSSKITELKQALDQGQDADDVIAHFSQTLETGELERLQDKINLVFNASTPLSILETLSNMSSEGDEWAEKTHSSMRMMSPLSVACSHASINQARAYTTIEECLANEYRFTVSSLSDHDFFEGIRAVIIEKDNKPQWQPPTLEEVSQDMVARKFAHLGDAEWTPI